MIPRAATGELDKRPQQRCADAVLSLEDCQEQSGLHSLWDLNSRGGISHYKKEGGTGAEDCQFTLKNTPSKLA